ncbi:MAG: hypothetical protein AB7G11_17970 [Phycisphaerales bacterium]
MFGQGTRRLIGTAIVSVACLALSAGGVLAQGGGPGGPGGGGPGGGRGGFGGMFGGGQQAFEPSIDSQDIDGMTTLFGFDKAQKEAVKQLFDGYQQEFAAAAKDMRAKFDAAREEMRNTGDRSVMGEVMEKMGEFRKHRSEMEKSFLGDVKAVLTEQQLQKWPRFERDRRRTETIGNGLMSGENVDLVRLVKDLKLPAETQSSLEPTLDQYTVELDPALDARNKMYEDMQSKIREMFQGGDPDAMEEMVKKGREVSTRVRDVNRKFAAQIETALPAEKQSEFATAFRRESFPRVYRPTQATRVVDAAVALKDLTADQKSAIEAIRDSYHRDLAAIQKDMEGATEEMEANFSPRNMMQRGGFGNDDSKLGDLQRRRRELDRDTAEKVNALLTEEQREKLPRRDANDGQDGGQRGPRGRNGQNDGAQPGDNGGRRNRQPGRNE